MKKILILDDDISILDEVANLFSSSGFHLICCSTAEEAGEKITSQGAVNFAIVDLFLLGAKGDALSNGFIRDVLQVNGIPYGRFTSAPSLVPTEYSGEWILDKRQFYSSPVILLEKVSESLNLLP
jgi:DNA-binding NtrC family response regulator